MAPPVNPVSVGKVEEVTEDELVNNPYILPGSLAVGPNSFADSRQEARKLCPPPKYFTDEILKTPLPTEKEKILDGFKEKTFGTFVFTNQEKLDKQKGVLVDVFK